MYLKFIRLLNFYWGLIGSIVVFGACILLLTLVKDDKWTPFVMDVVIELAFAWALFIGFYLIRLCFRRAQYPFISAEGIGDFHSRWLSKTSDWTLCWLIIVPIICAIAGPTLWFSLTIWSMDSINPVKLARIGIFLAITIASLANNLSYVYVLWKKQKQMRGDFSVSRLA